MKLIDNAVHRASPAQPAGGRGAPAAFSLVETLVGMAVFGVTFVSLYAALVFGFNSIQFSRENLRATQILVEKMEVIRLYSWQEVNTAGFIPTTFQATYAPGATTTTYEKSGSKLIPVLKPAEGTTYSGTISITDPSMWENYRSRTKLVTLNLSWKTGKVQRSRSLSTLVAYDGLYYYVY